MGPDPPTVCPPPPCAPRDELGRDPTNVELFDIAQVGLGAQQPGVELRIPLWRMHTHLGWLCCAEHAHLWGPSTVHELTFARSFRSPTPSTVATGFSRLTSLLMARRCAACPFWE